MKYEAFDPSKHKDKQIYELQARRPNKNIEFILVPSDVSFDEAKNTPWYYAVEAEGA